jgi:hypothetical protein
MSSLPSIFSSDDIHHLTTHPDVIKAKETLNNPSRVVAYCTIPLTDSLRTTLQTRFGLSMTGISTLPMRWIVGDTPPHVDSGRSKFNHTYLVYLTTNPGTFTIGDQDHPITQNTGFIFDEGVSHRTHGTGTEPRLIVGPMNEFAEPVGALTTITYYSSYANAIVQNNNSIASQEISWVLNDTQYMNGSINSYTTWRIASISGSSDPIPTGVYANGFDLATLGFGGVGFYVYPSVPCFLQGTMVLCQVDGAEIYRPIETLRPGDLVRTHANGYKKVALIGEGTIQNAGTSERIQERLYKCSPAKYPSLTQDLYITGCHSILVDTLTDEERARTIETLGKVYVTDGKYRLIACVDARAEPWASASVYTVWHIALENDDERMNYGIYVNGGLLVETCSIHLLKYRANMALHY